MISSYRIYLKLLIVFSLNFCYSQEFKGFDDTILYKINWPGKDVTDRLAKVSFHINKLICLKQKKIETVTF